MKFKPDHGPQQIQRIEEGEFSTVDILIIIWTTVRKLRDKASIILWSSFILLSLWGFHGDMAILTALFGEDWIETITFHLPWGKQLASFVVGFLLMVVIPCLIIKFVFKENIRDYGLGLPEQDQRQKARVAFFSLLIIASVLVFFASFDKGMQREYPLFTQQVDGQVTWAVTRWWEFIVYELIYLLFFITIEFSFRGYLLFGLNSIRMTHQTGNGQSVSSQRFGLYSILIQMLAYTTWHYGKPVPEMLGTIIWGICVAAIALRIKSIWPIIISHWLYNVFLDFLLWAIYPLLTGG
jgi:hypothetical protein